MLASLFDVRHLLGWRAFGYAALVVGLLGLAVPGMGQSAAEQRAIKAEEPTWTDVPTEVQDALERAAQTYARPLRGARWSKISLLKGTDHPLYQFRGTNDRDHRIEAEVTAAGRVLEVEEHGIPLSEVPDVVTEALKAQKPFFEPTLVEAVYQAEKAQPTSYGFEGKDAAGKKVEVYVSAEGKILTNGKGS